MGNLEPRMAPPPNSGSTVFCTIKGARRDMKIILMVFLKLILFRSIWSFCCKNSTSSPLDLLSDFFPFSTIKAAKRQLDIFLVAF